MKNWERLLVNADCTIRDLMSLFEQESAQIGLVVTAQRVLLGTVTDGDIRRAILSGNSLETHVSQIMNEHPTIVTPGMERQRMLDLMESLAFKYLPVVDEEDRVVNIYERLDLIGIASRENPVVILAGGEGKRLRPLTESKPKPMLEIGGRPILENILVNLVNQGLHNIFFSVNYLAEQIEDYFKDGKKWRANIKYLREPEKLGTAGPLSLLPTLGSNPILIVNGDLVTRVNFTNILDFHESAGAAATVATRQMSLRVPFGVVGASGGGEVMSFDEKPQVSFSINCGIYVLNPDCIHFVSQGQMDMPQLLESLIKDGRRVSSFPIHEYWTDVGRHSELEQVRKDFDVVF